MSVYCAAFELQTCVNDTAATSFIHFNKFHSLQHGGLALSKTALTAQQTTTNINQQHVGIRASFRAHERRDLRRSPHVDIPQFLISQRTDRLIATDRTPLERLASTDVARLAAVLVAVQPSKRRQTLLAEMEDRTVTPTTTSKKGRRMRRTSSRKATAMVPSNKAQQAIRPRTKMRTHTCISSSTMAPRCTTCP